MSKNSILEYFLEHATQRPNDTAALTKRQGTYQTVTWSQMADEAKSVAKSLLALGVQPEDRVNIICKTCLEWATLDMGILWTAGITVPIYPSCVPDECHYILNDSGCVVIFAEDTEQVEKFTKHREAIPHIKKIVQLFGAVKDACEDFVISYEEFIKLGAQGEEELEKRKSTLTRESILTLIYTSGTTGLPKGVVTTHDNMIYEAEAIAEIKIVNPTDVQLFWLPLAHSFAKVLEIGWISVGHVMAFAESMDTIKDNLGEVKPTLMAGVPRLYEKFHAAVLQKGTAPGGLKATLFNAATALSQKNSEAHKRGASLGFVDSLKFGLLKQLVFKKIGKGLSETLGGRIKYMISGGAPLAPQIAWFLHDAGVKILEGWGLTETSAATCVNHIHDNTVGTVGFPMPGTEIRIADDGEILVKGRGVMREYWNNPEATAEMLHDGWFHTGDIGSVESDGKVRITDRKKDIIVTAAGKNIAPQNIENLIKTNKMISQVVVHGDKRKFLSALITLDEDALTSFAKEKNINSKTYAELSQLPEVQQAVQEIIDQFNVRLARFETIKKFKILDHDFSVDSGELTPSVKVKRKVVFERNQPLLDAFYQE